MEDPLASAQEALAAKLRDSPAVFQFRLPDSKRTDPTPETKLQKCLREGDIAALMQMIAQKDVLGDAESMAEWLDESVANASRQDPAVFADKVLLAASTFAAGVLLRLQALSRGYLSCRGMPDLRLSPEFEDTFLPQFERIESLFIDLSLARASLARTWSLVQRQDRPARPPHPSRNGAKSGECTHADGNGSES